MFKGKTDKSIDPTEEFFYWKSFCGSTTCFNHRAHDGMKGIISGQIIATSHDLTPNGGLVREITLFQGNLGWWNIIIWPDNIMISWFDSISLVKILKLDTTNDVLEICGTFWQY